MSTGPFFNTDPILLTLAADQRFGPLNPELDAVWQIKLKPNGPLALETNFGLRVERFRIFPVFLVNNKAITEIGAFLSPPRVDLIRSNYVSLSCSPAAGLQARCEFWAAWSDTLLSRVSLTNTGSSPINLGIQSAADLRPREGIQGMNAAVRGYQPYLLGSSGSLFVAAAHVEDARVVSSPYPALQQTMEIAPGGTFTIRLRCCTGMDASALEAKLFQPHPDNWDAQIARLALRHQADLLRVSTPNPEWDAVFLSAQNQAFQLLARSEREPDLPFYLERRSPEQSFAEHADGNNALTVLQPPFNALSLYQLTQVLLPTQAQTAAKIFSGRINSLPDCSRLPGNYRVVLPFPCLCANALSIFLQTRDHDFLKSVYSRLRRYTLTWFDKDHDLDRDGLPEWLTISQTGWHNHPSFNFLNPHGLFTWIAAVENLGLCQLLARELDALEQIARALNDLETSTVAQSLSHRLADSLDKIREILPEASCWDRDTHLSTPHSVFFEGAFSDIPRGIHLNPASRVNIKLIFSASVSKPACVCLRGTDAAGKMLEERVDASEILRLADCLALTSNSVFSRLESVSAPDLDGQTWTQLYAADLTLRDVGWFLAWEASPPPEESPERRQTNGEDPFQAYPFGLPEYFGRADENDGPQLVNPAWNTLVLEGLIQRGDKRSACALFASLMRGAAGVLRGEHASFEAWKSLDNLPAGTRGAAAGLVPLQAFLDLVGVRILAPDKVQISGEYPFDWPLTLRYQGLEITRSGKNSTITLPDGTVCHHFGSQAKTFQPERD